MTTFIIAFIFVFIIIQVLKHIGNFFSRHSMPADEQPRKEKTVNNYSSIEEAKYVDIEDDKKE
jgi:Na+-transporting methylmalonyl-CoA/oxaloacetate decarboxylase gamma subunit